MRLIETVRVRAGRAPLWDLHLTRLRRSALVLGIPLEPIEPPAGTERVVRLVASAGGIGREDRPVAPVAALSVAFSGVAHPGYPHKTDQRAHFDAALAEACLDRADEALLSTESGWVAEGTFTALFWWDGARLAAPPQELGILPSVARARIAEISGGLVERRVDPRGLRGRPIFLANAARGIMEVASLHGERVPRDQRTDALARWFWP
ncbi:MAG TPA: aminotransferase class IV [Gemmatimonadales bacterium]|nr:aminotransferase class IV [Gemmatimonadales bacterium]